MKKILGLDLGTSSIGWALVNEAETEAEKSSITKLGVRVIHYDTFTNGEGQEIKGSVADEFSKGKSVSPNASRTKARSMRRRLQRYKLRRNVLIKFMQSAGWMQEDALLNEQGNRSTFQTLFLRSKAASEMITLEELARVFLNLNKKRGYKSSRKASGGDEGNVVDGLSIAKMLYEEEITPGEYVFRRLQKGKFNIPDFYRSDLRMELDKIWNTQRNFYPEILTDELKHSLMDKSKGQIWKICQSHFNIVGVKREFKGKELKLENYRWRSEAAHQKVGLEQLTVVLQEVCDHIKASSGYLGNISDRSKELYFANLTVGQWQWRQIEANPHHSLKNQVFFRQDYMDEFERIWEVQAKYHKELTDDLKKQIRDVVIFYQRPLRSQKGLVSLCEFEHWTKEVEIDGKRKKKTFGLKVCPKSSPLFQEFKIWQVLNNLKVNDEYLDQDSKDLLFKELSVKGKLSAKECLSVLYGKKAKEYEMNYKEVEGNNTQAILFKAYSKILEISGHECDLSKMQASEALSCVKEIFAGLGYKTDFLHFDSSLVNDRDFQNQPMYRLWHLLYSFEGDKSMSGNQRLVEKIQGQTGMDVEAAKILASVTFASDYGSLSSKAIRRILPYMREGNEYSLACAYAGYRHSAKSLTKEELEDKIYKDQLEPISKNGLRNPVVEKILNQMVNVVNEVIMTYGKPDEIRVELARELKKSVKERKEMSDAIGKSAADHEKIRKILVEEFGLTNPSRNDVVRYKLYRELETNRFHTLYSDTYVSQEKLFSKDFDIEHIIPQAKLFDDSFSNKTLEARQTNIEKSNSTAYDFVERKYGEEGLEKYVGKVEKLFQKGFISKAKRNKLLMREADIPQGFIERDLRETQYIAKLAKGMLEDLVKHVVSTSGAITERLREDWQLVDVMKELNWDKYDRLGMTEVVSDKEGRRIYRIKDWTKRNDHRHHAVDALAIAFTRRCFIQYLNNLNSRIPRGLDDKYVDLSKYELYDLPEEDRTAVVRYIESNMMHRDSKGRLRFVAPMPLEQFRAEAKRHIENILISIKSKGKVATRNINTVRKKDGASRKVQLTPRGQLHNETVYGKIALNGKTIYTKREEVTPSLKLDKVIDEGVRRILQARLDEFGGDAQKAFSNLEDNPIWLNRDRGIAIKRVTITGKSTVVPLHYKKDNTGRVITDAEGEYIPTDYVSTGSNHHIAIYADADGNLQEQVVSFYEAVTRVNLGMPVIDYDYKKEEGWKFLFTMKQNEYFVFPNPTTGFDPNEVDLMNPKNYARISPNLFRVQKIASKNYFFRHHLETTVAEDKQLINITYKPQLGLKGIRGIVKVRINHIGEIVKVGE